MLDDSIITALATLFADSSNKSCAGVRYGSCEHGNCMTLKECISESATLNPYAFGIKGIWKPDEHYAYYSNRTYRNPNSRNSSDSRFDGIYSAFTPYWQNSSGNWIVGNDSNWVRSNLVSHTTYGQDEVENMNALGNYSALLLGYNQTKVVAVAQNSRYTEMFNDNFEDYNYLRLSTECNPLIRRHLFEYEIQDCLDGAGVSPDISIDPFIGDVPDLDTAVILIPGDRPECWASRLVDDPHTGLTSWVVQCSENPTFRFPIISVDSCSDHFSLIPEREYIFSVWIKDPNAAKTILSYDIGATLDCGNNASTTVSCSGYIIDGWQKMETKFRVPANRTRMELSFTSASTDTIYIDDVRIHPFNATMVTSVYNPHTLQLMAQLDESNYATFYQYDDALQLNRINQETDQGILTTKEFFTNLHKAPSGKMPPKPKNPKPQAQ